MASYTRVLHSIWADEDFTSIGADAQRLYLLLISQPDITAAGVLPLIERRWARLAPDTNPVDISTALDELDQAGFVVIDADTAELWVRSYIKHDELWRIPKGLISIKNARSRVLSPTIRELSGAALDSLTGGVSETHSETLTERVSLPQQPAASSQHPFPAASSREPGPSPEPSADPRPTPPAAAAAAIEHALDLAIATRLHDGKIHNPDGWLTTTAPTVRDELRPTIAAHIDAGCTPLEAATRTLRCRANAVIRAARLEHLEAEPRSNVIPLDPGAIA